jgi:hypothetical protein
VLCEHEWTFGNCCATLIENIAFVPELVIFIDCNIHFMISHNTLEICFGWLEFDPNFEIGCLYGF